MAPTPDIVVRMRKSSMAGGNTSSSDGVRRRKGRESDTDHEEERSSTQSSGSDCKAGSVGEDEVPQSTEEKKMASGTYWLARITFIRALGFVYFVAFLVALDQNKELLGKNGLLPIPAYLSRLRQHFKVPANSSANWEAVSSVPTLLWWVEEGDTDLALDCIAYSGLALSGLLVVWGAGNAVIFTILWALYHSIVNVGQRWYSFGWESQLLETGFLAIFLSPLISLHRLPRHTPTPWVVNWSYRWVVFRIMFGAGMIKIRGDQCWRDLTCMNYHYQTQPVPNPLSYYLHQSPEYMHMFETLTNHAVELVFPFLLFLPQPLALIGGLIQILFQVVLIVSGNLSFLNWLTLIPAIMCCDDKSLCWLFSSATRHRVIDLQQYWKNTKTWPLGYYIRQVSSVALAGLIVYLSIPVVQNLLSSRQIMNSSFDSLRIVNTYGAFGSVTKERTEVILEGTYNSSLGVARDGGGAKWLEIEFKCKPGSTDRRPCLISPYHYRLDWLMWFAAFQSYQYNPWLLHLAGKILAGDPSVNSLLAHNPFSETPPKYVRALHYQYQYTEMGSEAAARGEWWSRKLIGQLYMPVVSTEQLRPVIEAQGWQWYTPQQNSN